MADEVAKGAGELPAGIERSRLVVLPVCGRTVEIRRWSYTKGLAASNHLYKISAGLPDDVAGDMDAALQYFFEKGGDRVLDVARMSLIEKDQDVAGPDIDHQDAHTLIREVFDLNRHGDPIKNSFSLAGRFVLSKVLPKTEEPQTTPDQAKKS
jgi:hypothetical protein